MSDKRVDKDDVFVIKHEGWDGIPDYIPIGVIKPYHRLIDNSKEISPQKLCHAIDYEESHSMSGAEIKEWFMGFVRGSLQPHQMFTSQLRIEVGNKVFDLLGGSYSPMDGWGGRKALYFHGSRRYPMGITSIVYLGDEFACRVASRMEKIGLRQAFTSNICKRITGGDAIFSILSLPPRAYYIAALEAVAEFPRAMFDFHQKEDEEDNKRTEQARKEQGIK